MFDKSNRYMTKGIQEKISIEIQRFLWNCVDTLKEKGQELDYLQVFELTSERADDILFQKIEHRQEFPKYNKIYKIFAKEIVDAKVFIIDDKEYSTMLLAEEY